MKIKNLMVAVMGCLLLTSCGNLSSSDNTTTYSVSFFDDETLLNKIDVKEGDKVTRPTDPIKDSFTFDNWYMDKELSTLYDFSLPVKNDLSIYASFLPVDYFAKFNKSYLPDYSMLEFDETIYSDMKDVSFSFSPKLITFNNNINTSMIYPFGAFSNLKVNSIKVEDNVLKVQTEGQIGSGKGYFAFAKEVSDAELYITTTIDVIERKAFIDNSTFRLVEENKKLDFTIAMTNIVLNNADNLSKEDYMAKVNSQEINCFSVTPSERYSLQMIDISDDFSSFRLRLSLPDVISKDIATELLETTIIHITGESLSNGTDYDFHIDLMNYSTKSDVRLYRYTHDEFRGKFTIKLLSCLVTNTFSDNLDKVIADPINKNLIISISGVEVVVNSLSVTDITTLTGYFSIAASEINVEQVTISLGEIKVSDELSFHVAKNWYDDTDISTIIETTSYQFDDSFVEGGGTGSVNQTASQCYRNVKTVVEQSTFEDSGTEEENDADKVINAATNIGMIGYGLYSGDFSTARGGASKLLGIEAIADPTTKVLNMLNSIYDKLLEIERKIDSIIDQLDVIQGELEDLGQQSLLSNYLAAHSAWKDFVTDYYTPLQNNVVSYSNDYFRYYYNLVIDSYNLNAGDEPVVTLCYDKNNELAFPSRNSAISIDGKMIDRSKTKTIVIPQLNYSLIGIFEHDGHVYPGIEENLIADLFSYGIYEENIVKDVIRTIRYNAMKNHFADGADLDAFTSTFTNFCTAFTSTEFGASTNTSITPLDSYRIMLETVYNFGFEIEPEFNLVISKIESTYYCSRSILRFVQYINAGEIISTRYDDLNESVKKEFTDTRFYHDNIDPKTVYCYSTGCYLTYSLEALGIAIEVTGDYDSGYDEDAYLNRGENYDVYNHNEPSALTSIDEASVRLMALKVKLYNNLKGSSFNFGEYLAQIGIIPKDKLSQTLGVILEIGELEDDDDDIEDMSFPSNWLIDCDRSYTYAFTGKSYSFVDGNTVNGLCAITYNAVSTPLGSYVGIGDVTNVGIYDSTSGYNYGVWAYFVNFIAVSPNP